MEALQFGPYRVTRKLGEGAMGAVFAATQEGSGRLVAVKVLPKELAHRPGFRVRFEIEIETLRKLDHPNIVHIYAWGLTEGGTIYYAMEMVDGDNLEHVAGSKPMPWRRVLDLGCQLCRALKHAHDRGVIHRDIKPANIMMTRQNQAKLSDFGIAHLYGNMGLTLEGGPIGTANYMSPEQTDGKRPTQRSDLYSLGCTLYALLAGRPPFLADSLFEMLNMHRNAEPPPVTRFAPDVPPEFWGILRTLLNKKPEDRLPNAAMLMRSLQMVERSQAMLEETTRPGVGALSHVHDAPTRVASEDPNATLEGSGAERRGGNGHGATTETIAGKDRRQSAGASEAAKAGELDATVARTSQPATTGPPTADVAQPLGEEAKGLGSTVILREGSRDPAPAAATVRATAVGEAAWGHTIAGAGQLVTVEEAAQRDREAQLEEVAQEQRIRSRQTMILTGIVLVVLVGLLTPAWYFIYRRPYLPDQIFARIRSADEEESPEREKDLVYEKKDIEDFLDRFPHDSRVVELKRLLEEIQFTELETRLHVRAVLDLTLNGKPRPTIERLYDEAIAHAKTEPDMAVAKLEQLLDLYAGSPITSDDKATAQTQNYLNLAHWKLEKLIPQAVAYTSEQIDFVRNRLDAIQAMRKSNPRQARRACQALIEIFSGRPWAQASMRRAQAILASLPEDAQAETRPAIAQTMPDSAQ